MIPPIRQKTRGATIAIRYNVKGVLVASSGVAWPLSGGRKAIIYRQRCEFTDRSAFFKKNSIFLWDAMTIERVFSTLFWPCYGKKSSHLLTSHWIYINNAITEGWGFTGVARVVGFLDRQKQKTRCEHGKNIFHRLHRQESVLFYRPKRPTSWGIVAGGQGCYGPPKMTPLPTSDFNDSSNKMRARIKRNI